MTNIEDAEHPHVKQNVPNAETLVYVVDDDISVRESLELLLRSEGFNVKPYPSAEEFLLRHRPDIPHCLILDVSLPGLSGLELQRSVAAQHPVMPIIFITGHGDIPMTVQAMKTGAVEFLTKPFNDEVLLGVVRAALARSEALLAREAELRALRARYAKLTPRECEVMALVVSGLANKQVAAHLAISEVTVKAHRGSLMRKMEAPSLPDLVRMSSRLRPSHTTQVS